MIYFIFHIFKSKLDVSGNTYWAVRITSTRDNSKVWEFQLGNGSRFEAERFLSGLVPWDGYYTCETEMSKRDFRAKTKAWAYSDDTTTASLKDHAKEVQNA